jgi:hypothetical protein
MATATKRNGAETKARPVHEIRLGRIKAAIWANETEKGTRHNVTIQRIYVDDAGQWQTSSSFGRDDLPLVAKVADLAHTWIFLKGDSGTDDQGERDVHY